MSSTYLRCLWSLSPFSLSVETLKVFSQEEVKSLSEIPLINSTLQTDSFTNLVFELNVTVSFVKICLGHLPCGSSIASFAGLPTKHQFHKSIFWVPRSHAKRLVCCLLFSLLCSLKGNLKKMPTLTTYIFWVTSVVTCCLLSIKEVYFKLKFWCHR